MMRQRVGEPIVERGAVTPEDSETTLGSYLASYADDGSVYALYRHTKSDGVNSLEYLKPDGWHVTQDFMDHWIARGALRITEERARQLAATHGVTWPGANGHGSAVEAHNGTRPAASGNGDGGRQRARKLADPQPSGNGAAT